MADRNINIDLNLNGSQSVRTIGDLKDEMKGATNEAKSLKAQLREMTNQLAELDAGTEEFKRLSAEAGKLRDQIADTNAVINATAGNVVENLGKGLGSIAKIGIAGFQGVEGALAMFGVESENAQKAMAALQGSMALTQAIETFGGLGDTITAIKASFMGLVQTLGLVGTAEAAAAVETEALGAAQTATAVSTGVATTAMKLLRVALISTGLGAIVVAIGLLIANFDTVTEYVMKAYNWFDKLGIGVKYLILVFNPLAMIIYGIIKALEYFGVIDGKEERDRAERHKRDAARADEKLKKQEKLNKKKEAAYNSEQKLLDRQIKLLEAEGKSSDDLQIKKTKNSITHQKEKLKELQINQFILKSILDQMKASGAFSESYQEIYDENNKVLVETKENIKDLETDLKILEINKSKNKKKSAEDNKKEADSNKELAGTLDELTKKNEEYGLSEKDLALLQYNRLVKQIEAQYKLSTDKDKDAQKEKALELALLQYKQQISDINTKSQKDADDKKKEARKEYYDYIDGLEEDEVVKRLQDLDKETEFLDKMLADGVISREKHDEDIKNATKKAEDDITKIQADAAEERKKIDDEEKQKRIDTIQDTISSIQAIEQAVSDSMSALFDLRADRLNREKNELDAKHQKELSNLKEGSAEYEATKKKQAEEDEIVARKQFELNKRTQLSAAIMNALMGITSIIAQYPKFDGGIAMYATLAATAITNAAAIAKIAATQYEGGNTDVSPNGGGSGGGSFNPSTFYNLGNGGPQSNTNTSGGGTKVYVLEKDISHIQRKVSVIERRSVLGN